MLNVTAIREDFPILNQKVHGGVPLIYLDSAATSQKPQQVLQAELEFYRTANAAVHRGAHALAERATEHFETARRTIAHFIGAEPNNIVYTKNATESINIVSYGFSNATAKFRQGSVLAPGEEAFVLSPGDEIVLSEMEHHANLVPWQEVCLKTGAELRFIQVTDDGRLDLDHAGTVIGARTRVVSLVHQSNILGTVNDIDAIGELAKKVDAWFVVDACQSIPHMEFSIAQHPTVDFLAFSGHKMLGPLGIGVLWGSTKALDALPVFVTGGSMIATVHLDHSTYAKAPLKFEAGTQMSAQAVGLAAAADYLSALGMANVAEHEHTLTATAVDALKELPGVTIIGPQDATLRGSAISFTVDGLHPHDVGQVLDSRGVAVRVGHHCAWPTCRRFGVPATTRASFYIYNSEDDIQPLLDGIVAAQKFFGVL